MMPGNYQAETLEEPELGRAIETEQYRQMLTRYLDELTILYENLLAKILRGQHSEELIDACISKMISLMIHLLPKLMGGGEASKEMLAKFEPYNKWITNMSLPKTDPDEADKLPELYVIILETYDHLGISNY